MADGTIGPYVIERRLATGGMAEVYVARREGPHGFQKRVAFKRILPQYARDPDFVSMFIDEARLAAQLDHPNIVSVFDFGEVGDQLYIAMELVEGTNVNRVLRAVAARAEAVPFEVALPIVAETAHALAYAHGARDRNGERLRCVHRDVSPANILLTKDGHVKLTDFGIAKVAARDAQTDDGHVRGKLGYMSPEQVTGRPLDGRSDVFTLTTVLAEMLLAEPLFGEGSELSVLLRIRDVDLGVLDRSSRRIPKDLRRLIVKGLARHPEDRPHAKLFAAACDEVMRRRGLSPSSGDVARIIRRLELVASERDSELPQAHGGRMTSLVDTTGVTVSTDAISERYTTTPSIYRVRMPDGHVLGPMSYPKLIELMTGGRMDASDLVSREDGEFLAASGFPELHRFVGSSALQWKLDEIEDADRRGGLEGARLLPVVHGITTGYDTGVLHLWDDERRKKVYFVEGEPEFVASTMHEELLGEYLVASGLVLKMEVEMALALMPRYGGHLGDALVGLGILRPVELFRAISSQVRRKYLEAFRWRKGQWAFVPDVRSHEDTFPLGQTSRELMRDAALEAHPAELERAMSAVDERVLARTPAPPCPMSVYRLPTPWARLIEGCGGDSTFSSILAAQTRDGSMDAEDVYRAIYFGISTELLSAA